MWAFCFVIGPYLGPFVSSWLLAAVNWRLDMGILASFYALSTILVVLFGEETLYDRKAGEKPTLHANKFLILIGIAGAKAEGQPKMQTVFIDLVRLVIKPQLLLPCKCRRIYLPLHDMFSKLFTISTNAHTGLYVMILFTWAIGIVTTVTQFTRPPPYLLNDTQASLFYFAPIVGAIVGEFWGHWFNDFSANLYIRTHAGKYLPENRLWGVYLPAILAAVSLILYGQTLQNSLPLVALGASWSIMAFAQVAATTAISAYALDCFPHHAALASSWINFFRTTG
jgi:MFS family permease